MNSLEYFKSATTFQLIIQTNLSCNIRCKHCYEADGNYPVETMDYDTLEKIIMLAQKQYKKVSYLWFGGEPLIVGLDFYKKVVEFQRKYNANTEIKNSIQTNGILLTPEYIDFFKDNGFNVSISYDAQYNDVLRERTNAVETNIELCKTKNLKVSTISTISRDTSNKQIEMYDFLCSKNLNAKFNRIFPEGNGKVCRNYLISDEDYLSDMKEFFHSWLFNKNASSFCTFDIYLSALFNLSHRECIFSGCLFKWLAVTPNGTLLPCPRFGNSDISLGNIHDYDNLYEAFHSKNYEKLLTKNVDRRNDCQKNCKWFIYCNGGCNARCYWEGDIANPNTEICRFVKGFFPYIVSTVKDVIDRDLISNTNEFFQKLVTNNRDNFIKTINYCETNNLI